MRRAAVERLMRPTQEERLQVHKAILSLAEAGDSRLHLVTTNFDEGGKGEGGRGEGGGGGGEGERGEGGGEGGREERRSFRARRRRSHSD